MTDPEVVLTSSNHPTATWPHATMDCLSTAPCPSCYCYVCDVPIAQCDEPVAHAPADGRRDAWNTIKRRRSALLDTWTDIPTLVNIIVSLSVEEAVRRADAKHTATPVDDDDVQFISDALEKVVNIKHDTPSISTTNKPPVTTVHTPQVAAVQVLDANTVKKEPH